MHEGVKYTREYLANYPENIIAIKLSANKKGKISFTLRAEGGTTFDQGFVWETYNDLLEAAEILGTDDNFLNVVREQINSLDPILIGASGQVKEFRASIPIKWMHILLR